MKIVSKENIAWSAHQLSREISQRFVNNNTLVINTTWLSMGFETFDQEFGYYPTENWKDNANQIANLVDDIDVGIYNSLMPKLLHNKNWLKTAAQAEWQKVNELAKSL